MSSKIPIHYKNLTGQSDFQVLVFTKNYSTNTPRTYYAAWEVLNAQTETRFSYPVSISVGATYSAGDQEIISGPFDAKLGTTWSITQDSIKATANLQEVAGSPPNPDNTIVIKNMKPVTWSGRKFDIGVYKSDKLLVVQKDVRIGDQVDFMLQPRIFFAVVRNMFVGKVFTSLEITSALTEFDLSNYPNGITVSLSQAGGSGQYSFSGEQLM